MQASSSDPTADYIYVSFAARAAEGRRLPLEKDPNGVGLSFEFIESKVDKYRVDHMIMVVVMQAPSCGVIVSADWGGNADLYSRHARHWSSASPMSRLRPRGTCTPRLFACLDRAVRFRRSDDARASYAPKDPRTSRAMPQGSSWPLPTQRRTLLLKRRGTYRAVPVCPVRVSSQCPAPWRADAPTAGKRRRQMESMTRSKDFEEEIRAWTTSAPTHGDAGSHVLVIHALHLDESFGSDSQPRSPALRARKKRLGILRERYVKCFTITLGP